MDPELSVADIDLDGQIVAGLFENIVAEVGLNVREGEEEYEKDDSLHREDSLHRGAFIYQSTERGGGSQEQLFIKHIPLLIEADVVTSQKIGTGFEGIAESDETGMKQVVQFGDLLWRGSGEEVMELKGVVLHIVEEPRAIRTFGIGVAGGSQATEFEHAGGAPAELVEGAVTGEEGGCIRFVGGGASKEGGEVTAFGLGRDREGQETEKGRHDIRGVNWELNGTGFGTEFFRPAQEEGNADGLFERPLFS